MSIGTMLDSIPDINAVNKAHDIIGKYHLNTCNKSNQLRFAVPQYKDFFALTYFMNAQMKAKEIELLLIETLHGTPVPASDNLGDGLINGKYYELKTSTTNKGNKLNIRQIRPWQHIDYYLCSYINELHLEQSRFFLLTQEEMHHEIQLIGGYTHGTKTANINNVNTEYSITIDVYNNSNINTKRWNDKYAYDDIYYIICGQ